ncbi:hypothetical protein Tco_0490551 [Tanacetum coccineum]
MPPIRSVQPFLLNTQAFKEAVIISHPRIGEYALVTLQRPKLEKVDKDQKDGVVALELEKIAGSSGRF